CVMLVITLMLWLKPHESILRKLRDSDLPERTGLPVMPSGSASVAWWGMIGLITILGSGFAALVYSYFYIRLFSPQWPQDGLSRPNLWIGAAAFGALLVAGVIQNWGLRRFRMNEPVPARWFMAGPLLAGMLYLALQLWDWASADFTLQTNAYGSLFFVLSGA